MSKQSSTVVAVLTLFLIASLLVIVHDRYFFHNLLSENKRELEEGQSNITFGTDLAGGIQATMKPRPHKRMRPKELEHRLNHAAEIIRNRLLRYGDLEPDVRVSSDNRMHILIPGLQDPDRIVDILDETGSLQIYLLRNSDDAGVRQRLVRTLHANKTANPEEIGVDALFSSKDFAALIVDTEDIGQVEAQYDAQSGQRYISFVITSEAGKRRMQNAMYQYGGFRVAVVFSGEIKEVLTLGQADTRIPVTSGTYAITSEEGFSKKELQDYLILLESRPLPIELELERRDYVYPSAGSGTFKKLTYLLVGGFVIASGLLYLVYGELLGTVGALLIVLTVFMQLGVYAVTGLVITLPGLAGLLLNIGITIDAAILIFEKIKKRAIALKRTEAREDTFMRRFESEIAKTLEKSTKVVWVIRITNLAGAAGILFYTENQGPVAGFGWALLIGSVISLLLCSRPVFSALFDFCNSVIFGGSTLRETGFGVELENTVVMRIFRWFLKRKRLLYRVLLAGIAVSLLLIFVVGFNFGLDFTGGNNLRFAFSETILPGELRKVIGTRLQTSNFTLRELAGGEGNLFDLRTPVTTSDSTLKALLADLTHLSDFKIIYNTAIGPGLSKDEITRALKAAGLVMVIIWLVTVFLFTRNRLGLYDVGRLRYYTSRPLFYCVLAIVHDLLLLGGFLVVFRIELSASIVGVLFLLIGYSINDSLILFTELGEKQRNYFDPYFSKTAEKLTSAKAFVDDGLDRIAIRTLLTSFSTIIVLIPLAIVGDYGLRNYSVAVVVGITIGTLSSLFFVSNLIETYLQRLGVERP